MTRAPYKVAAEPTDLALYLEPSGSKVSPRGAMPTNERISRRRPVINLRRMH